MKITVRRILVGSGVLVAVLLAVAWLLWPTATPTRSAKATRSKRMVAAAPPVVAADLVEEREEGDVLERLGIDPEVTPNCALINQWHDRHVPMWVILDNMDAQAMTFHNEELDCLTTSPTPPAILTWAENHINHRANNAALE